MIIHDNSIKKIVEHRKNELSENIDTYVLKLYPNIGTYTIFEFHYLHTDNISIYIASVWTKGEMSHFGEFEFLIVSDSI